MWPLNVVSGYAITCGGRDPRFNLLVSICFYAPRTAAPIFSNVITKAIVQVGSINLSPKRLFDGHAKKIGYSNIYFGIGTVFSLGLDATDGRSYKNIYKLQWDLKGLRKA